MNHHHYTSGTTGDNNRGHTHGFTPSGSVSSSFSGHPLSDAFPIERLNRFTPFTGELFTETTYSHSIQGYASTGEGVKATALSLAFTPSGSVSSSFSGDSGNTDGVSQNHTHTWGNWSGNSYTTENNSTARYDTDSTGSGTSFSILPPYVVKYCFERTA